MGSHSNGKLKCPSRGSSLTSRILALQQYYLIVAFDRKHSQLIVNLLNALPGFCHLSLAREAGPVNAALFGGAPFPRTLSETGGLPGHVSHGRAQAGKPPSTIRRGRKETAETSA